MENINTEFEEKVDIDDLVLTSKPLKLTEIKSDDCIKQEPFEEEEKLAAFESDHDIGKKFKLKMEENILKLYEELDAEKFKNLDFSLKRLLKIREFVEKIAQYDSLEKYHEPFSCKLCDKSFRQVHEVKEHIKIHDFTLKVEFFL